MSLVEARKEVSRITQALLAIKPEEEALEIARSIPDGDWFELIDDVPPIELIAREVQLLTAFQKRDELVRELVEALTTAKARVDELQMLMDEAFEAFGVTYGLCLRDYDPAAIAAVLAKAKAIDAGEETRS